MQNKQKRSKKIRKGDKVIAIVGNNRGQTGTVLSCNGDKVVVQGINVRKRHQKRSQERPQGGVIELEKPIHISNVRLCINDEKPVKVKVRANSNGERELYYLDGEQTGVYRSIKNQNL